MKRLIVVRHAKATHKPGFADPDRPLTGRGRRDAKAAGEWLLGQRLIPGLVLCSPSRAPGRPGTGSPPRWAPGTTSRCSTTRRLYLAERGRRARRHRRDARRRADAADRRAQPGRAAGRVEPHRARATWASPPPPSRLSTSAAGPGWSRAPARLARSGRRAQPDPDAASAASTSSREMPSRYRIASRYGTLTEASAASLTTCLALKAIPRPGRGDHVQVVRAVADRDGLAERHPGLAGETAQRLRLARPVDDRAGQPAGQLPARLISSVLAAA